ncbi:hypothetical protein LCGC14_1666950 [marine sediment metagenome]|uniref:Uncharacterized protein n=1 Tax=marine sediment metagenome TaxID=412755 RepID=A0A0F9HSD0_9ZZZZ
MTSTRATWVLLGAVLLVTTGAIIFGMFQDSASRARGAAECEEVGELLEVEWEYRPHDGC